jgi:hypothetical protein
MAQTTAALSTYNLVASARRVGATSVIVITVDRPFSKWVKVDIDAYDVDGKKLWTETDSEGGGITSSGKVEKALDVLKSKLSSRLGSTALPLRQP